MYEIQDRSLFQVTVGLCSIPGCLLMDMEVTSGTVGTS